MKKKTYPFLNVGGEMAELIAGRDWSSSPLGPIENWSPFLRVHLSMMLSSRFPMLIFWGKELITFYNDAFRPSLGDDGKHPSSLGQRGEQSWAESWPVIGPMIHNIMAGGDAVWFEDQKLPLYRDGQMGYAYWTYSFSPLRDGDEAISGILVTCAETTRAVENLQRLEEVKQQQEMAIEAAELGTFDYNPTTGKFTANARLKGWFGLKPEEEIALELALQVIADADRDRVAAAIGRSMELDSGGRYEEEYAIKHSRAAEPRIVQAKGQTQFDESGKAIRLAGTLRDVTQQVLTFQKKEEEQRNLLSLFEQSSVGIAIISRDQLTFRLANPFYGTLVDRKPEEIVGKPLLQALPEIAGQGFDALLNQVIETGNPFIAPGISVDIRRGDSIQTIYVDLAYQPMREPDGTISGVLVIATDVTQSVLSRQAIERSEAKFRRLITEAPFATALYVDEELRIDMANEAMIRLWGKDETVIGKPLDQALPELEGQPFLGLLAEVRRTGLAYSTKEQAADLVVDGHLQRFWFNFTYKPLLDEHGQVYGILNMAVDVSEQVRARKSLEEAELKLLDAIDTAQLGTWSIDVTTRKTSCSPRFCEWIGIENNTLHPGEGLPNVAAEDQLRMNQAVLRALETGSRGELDETYTVVHGKTGQKRILHLNGRVLRDAEGQPRALAGTAQDVTIRQQMQLALENEVQQRTEELAAAIEELRATNEDMSELNSRLVHSNEELAQYAYVASHDLQEPLRKIRLFSSQLTAEGDLPPQIQRIVHKIQGSTERMSLLIQDLLAFSRLLRSDSLLRPVSLSTVVGDVISDFELLIQEKDARIEVGDLPVIEGVSLQMNQLFYNLVGNALKFTEGSRQPLVSIWSRLATAAEVADFIDTPLPHINYHHILVQDNGIGFDHIYLEQIFEVFKRLHGRQEYGGSGIGLAICRRVVQNHKGRIYAESSPGAGSSFHIILPERQSERGGGLPADLVWKED